MVRPWGHTVHYDVPFGTSSVVRLDVCTRPARIADPENLPARAMPYTLADGTTILVMGLSDLIQTKKTQRLKDWGAIEMLLAASIATSTAPSEALVRVWLEELRGHRGNAGGVASGVARRHRGGSRVSARIHERTRSHATGGTPHPPAVGAPGAVGGRPRRRQRALFPSR